MAKSPAPKSGKTGILDIIWQYGWIRRMECVRMDIWRFQQSRFVLGKSVILIYIQLCWIYVDLYCPYGSMLVHMDPYWSYEWAHELRTLQAVVLSMSVPIGKHVISLQRCRDLPGHLAVNLRDFCFLGFSPKRQYVNKTSAWAVDRDLFDI